MASGILNNGVTFTTISQMLMELSKVFLYHCNIHQTMSTADCVSASFYLRASCRNNWQKYIPHQTWWTQQFLSYTMDRLTYCVLIVNIVIVIPVVLSFLSGYPVSMSISNLTNNNPCRCTLPWPFQQPVMIERCFNIFNISPVANEFLCSIKICLHWERLFSTFWRQTSPAAW